MLEGLAAWVLNTYVGEYVENLNTSQFSVGLLQGQVELENLPLKKDAFRHLLLPLEIKAGFIGKICLNIPVTRLRTDPWLITIERLHVVLGPVALDSYDEEREETSKQNEKRSRLDLLEARWKASFEDKEQATYYSNSYTSWLTYGASFLTNVIRSLKLRIKDVHVRYEDSCESVPMACGLTIQNLTSENNDATTQDCNEYVSQSMQISGCAFYWDVNTTHLGSISDILELAAAMQRHLLTNVVNETAQPHTYVLSSTTATALVSRNCSSLPLRSRSKPRLTCSLQLDRFPVFLNELQYKQMVMCSRQVRRIQLSWKYLSKRPSVSIKENVAAWWRFAGWCVTANQRERNRRATWEFCAERAHDMVVYVERYSQFLNAPERMTSQEQQEKSHLERRLDFDALVILRELVWSKAKESRTETVKADVPPSQGMLQYWFPGWAGWYSGTNTGGGGSNTAIGNSEAATLSSGSDSPDNSDKLSVISGDSTRAGTVSSMNTSKIEEEILDALDVLDRETFLNRDSVLARISFALREASFSLMTLSPEGATSPNQDGGLYDVKDSTLKGFKQLIELKFADVFTQIESRPRSSSFLFQMRLGGLHLKDCLLETSVYQYLISPHNVGDPFGGYRHGRVSASDLFKAYNRSSRSVSSPPIGGSFLKSPTSGQAEGVQSLLEFTYERMPRSAQIRHKLSVRTESLDVVYSASTVCAVQDFFALRRFRNIGGVSARSRYEHFKNQTRHELRQTWDLLLEGGGDDMTALTKNRVPRWSISMDISAPRIIVPENFVDANATTVIFNLGRLQFCNVNADGAGGQVSAATTIGADGALSATAEAMNLHSTVSESNFDASIKNVISNDDDDDDDTEDFQTPFSTPPPEELPSDHKSDAARSPSPATTTFTEFDIRARMYERYVLHLQDVQILAGTGRRENWSFAQHRGTSHMHIIDRFTISLQLERRLVHVDDTQWPSATLSGRLPNLVIHVSETKIKAFQMCLNQWEAANRPQMHRSPLRQPWEQWDSATQLGTAEKDGNTDKSEQSHQRHHQSNSALLMVMQFTIDNMSLELQNRGKCIAELQVSGVDTTFTKRSRDSSVALCVHSLLLVDALQTYGPRF